jgi:nucleoside-triphosphatase THEP1
MQCPPTWPIRQPENSLVLHEKGESNTQKPTGNKRYIAIIIIDDKGEMETEDMFSKYMTQYRNHDMAASVVHNHNTVHTLKPQSKSGVFRNRLSIENSNNIAKAVA